jgi:hypothetical protein
MSGPENPLEMHIDVHGISTLGPLGAAVIAIISWDS